MEITVEMVERLREKAPVSYAQAKEALEYSEGNLLDALIYLEEKGAIPQAEGTRWSGREEKESQPTAAELVVQETPGAGKEKEAQEPAGRGGGVAQGGEATGAAPCGSCCPGSTGCW